MFRSDGWLLLKCITGFLLAAAQLHAEIPTVFTFQGHLVLDGIPVDNDVPGCDFLFRLWDDPLSNDPIHQIGPTLSFASGSAIPVADGRFTAELDFGSGAFDGNVRWLEISVACPSGTPLIPLAPRQPIRAAPYAIHALNGTGNSDWSLTGNSGTDPSTNFAGTIDDVPFEIRVNETRALRLEYAEGTFTGSPVLPSPNTIAGSPGNDVLSGVFGGTVAGGGMDGGFSSNYPNTVEANFGTVGGGLGNTASGLVSTVSGGSYNTASQNRATVGGGVANVASGQYATIPGGWANEAAGSYSFAAGRSAKAVHDGTYVWGDNNATAFSSTGPNQFLIRASGGVGIGTDSPGSALTVNGMIESLTGGFRFPDGTTQTTAATGGGGGGDGHSLDASDGDPIDALSVDATGLVTTITHFEGGGDVRAANDVEAEGRLRTQDRVELVDDVHAGVPKLLADLSTNTDGHGQFVSFASDSSVASAVMGTDSTANGAGGLVQLSFDDALGPAVKLHSVSNAGRAALARSTGLFEISESLVMYANAPEVNSPGVASNGGGIDLLEDDGTRTFVFRGSDDFNTGGCMQAFNSGGNLVFDLDTGSSNPTLRIQDGSGTINNQVEIAPGSSGGTIGVRNSSGVITVAIDGEDSSDGAGRVTTQKLAITGGSDLSEQFDIRSHDGGEPEPGMVVCIDPANPGKLIVSSRPYDRTVAGVVSGAGGVAPGMLMGQQDSLADGDHPVALTGRVYVLADAAAGPIAPGDLLTTSDSPGHAMKVNDHEKSVGAILGKAMTPLENGKGLVLALIALQ